MSPVDIQLPAEASSAAVARDAVRRLVLTAGPDTQTASSQQALDRVVLLTSEVVTNAVLHAGTPLRLTAAIEAGRAVVRVYDGARIPPRRRAYRNEDANGRGMHLVDALADQWGIEETAAGKCVWFSITVSAGEQAAYTG